MVLTILHAVGGVLCWVGPVIALGVTLNGRLHNLALACALSFATVVAGWLVVGETLSVAGSFSGEFLAAITWLTGVASLAFLVSRNRGTGYSGWPRRVRRLGAPVLVGAAAMGSAAAATLVTGFASAPNNLDSMAYHLPRIHQWLQQGSLAHFPTPYPAQNYLGPGAELAQASLLCATGTDHSMFLVQWISAITLVCAVFSCVRTVTKRADLGLVAAAVTALAPPVLGEAATTQNDLVATALVATALAVLLHHEIQEHTLAIVGVPLILGVAAAIKVPVAVFGLPLILWSLVSATRRANPRRTRALFLAATVAAVVVNLGWMSRNVETYGRPLGPDLNLTVSQDHARALALNGFKNIGHVVAVPAPPVANDALAATFATLGSSTSGLDVDDPRFTFTAPYTVDSERNEDRAAAPFQALVFIVGTALVLFRRRAGSLMVLASAASAYMIFSATVRYQTWGGRLMLTMLVYGGVLFGLSLAAVPARRRSLTLVALVLVAWVQGLPWMLAQKWRPLVSEHSVLLTDDQTELTASMSVDERARWTKSLELVSERPGTEAVGLVGGHSYAYEYLWWRTLVPQGIRILHVEPAADTRADLLIAPNDPEVDVPQSYSPVTNAPMPTWTLISSPRSSS